MDRDSGKRASRPAVSSLTGALAAVDAWLRENQYDEMRDGDGQVWRLETKVTQIPDKSDASGLLWQIQLKLSTAMSAEDLVRTHTLDATTDARLLALIADELVPLSVKPQTHVAPNEDEAKLILAESLPKLKADLVAKSLISVKRELVGRWIDGRGRFAPESY